MDIDDSIEELFEKGYAEVIQKDVLDIILNLSGDKISNDPDRLILWGTLQCWRGGTNNPTI